MMGDRIPLSDRSRTLFAIIAAVAEAGAATPSTAEMTAALQAAGHRIGNNPGLISYELHRLQCAGQISIIGRRARRVFEIPGTGHRTAQRRAGPSPVRVLALAEAKARCRAGQTGWPRPTPESAAAYDAAVRRREFARHEHPEPPGPLIRIRPPVRWSPTGCAAAMMAQW